LAKQRASLRGRSQPSPMGTGASKGKKKKDRGRDRRLSVTSDAAAQGGGGRGGGGASGTDGMNENGEKVIQATGRKLRYATLSQAGYEPDHIKKENQDNYCVCLKEDPNHQLFGVFDGHGSSGHNVSAFIREHMPKNIPMELCATDVNDTAPGIKMLEKAFDGVNSGLEKQRAIDISLSGSTCVVSMIRGQHILTANLGDSRCVLAREETPGQLTSVPLSQDQKPERPDEKRRVLKVCSLSPLFLILLLLSLEDEWSRSLMSKGNRSAPLACG